MSGCFCRGVFGKGDDELDSVAHWCPDQAPCAGGGMPDEAGVQSVRDVAGQIGQVTCAVEAEDLVAHAA